jgi:hypothetical protein
MKLSKDEIKYLQYKYKKNVSNKIKELNTTIKNSHKEIKKQNNEDKLSDKLFKNSFKELR